MVETEVLILALLVKVVRQNDRILAGQRREEHELMQIQDVLDQANVALTALETDDAAVLAKLTAIEANGGTLTDDQAAQAQAILQRIGALDAADQAALSNGTVLTPPASGADAAQDASV